MVSAVSDFPSLEWAEALWHPGAEWLRTPVQTRRGICRTNWVWVRTGGKPGWASRRAKNSTDVLEPGAENARGGPGSVLTPGVGHSEPLREKKAGLMKS